MHWPALLTWKGAKEVAAAATDNKRLRSENEQLREQMSLRDQLDAAKAENRLLRDENATLQQRIRGLEVEAADTSRVIYELNAAWKIDGDIRAGPFCPTCHGTTGKLVPLLIKNRKRNGDVFGECGSCNSRAWITDRDNDDMPNDGGMRTDRWFPDE